MSNAILSFFQSICRFNFGTFEKEEFKKFLRLGLIFALIIGVYWTLRPLKDSIFIRLADKLELPFAKMVSVISLLPLVMFYTKLLEKTSREKMLNILPAFYGILIFVFAAVMLFVQKPVAEMAGQTDLFLWGSKILAYVWYVFVESFGSLIVALFWAFSADTTEPTSARRGFPLVVAIGQMGGIVFPYFVGGLPYRIGLQTDSLSMAILGGLTLLIIYMVNRFLKVTPSHLLQSYHGKNEDEIEDKQEPGFLEGLKLLLSHRYLIGIFAANFIYEIIVTIFDFNFKLSAADVYQDVALSNYLSLYGSSVNIVSLLCLLLGISNVTRYLGVGTALALMPVIVGGALIGFLSIDTLNFLFALMVGSKAINYALNGPALKQLYIPTTPDVRFKAQAWIETFGSRASKNAGSIFNTLLRPLQSQFGAAMGRSYYLVLSGAIGFPLIVLWFVTAVYLGKTFKRSIESKTVVC